MLKNANVWQSCPFQNIVLSYFFVLFFSLCSNHSILITVLGLVFPHIRQGELGVGHWDRYWEQDYDLPTSARQAGKHKHKHKQTSRGQAQAYYAQAGTMLVRVGTSHQIVSIGRELRFVPKSRCCPKTKTEAFPSCRRKSANRDECKNVLKFCRIQYLPPPLFSAVFLFNLNNLLLRRNQSCPVKKSQPVDCPILLKIHPDCPAAFLIELPPANP